MGLNQGLCGVTSLQSVCSVARSTNRVTVFLHQNKQPVALVEPCVSLCNYRSFYRAQCLCLLNVGLEKNAQYRDI